MPERSLMVPRSIRSDGEDRRSFIACTRLWPPARNFPSVFFKCKDTASFALAGRWYWNACMSVLADEVEDLATETVLCGVEVSYGGAVREAGEAHHARRLALDLRQPVEQLGAVHVDQRVLPFAEADYRRRTGSADVLHYRAQLQGGGIGAEVGLDFARVR